MMIIKLVVIALIIVVGAILLVPHSSEIFSDPLSFVDSVKPSIDEFHNDAIQKVEGTFDGTVNAVDQRIDNLKEKSKDILNDIP